MTILQRLDRLEELLRGQFVAITDILQELSNLKLAVINLCEGLRKLGDVK